MNDVINALMIGKELLKNIKEEAGEEKYNEVINSPVKSCSCGFIKEGDYTHCPKCETHTN